MTKLTRRFRQILKKSAASIIHKLKHQKYECGKCAVCHRVCMLIDKPHKVTPKENSQWPVS